MCLVKRNQIAHWTKWTIWTEGRWRITVSGKLFQNKMDIVPSMYGICSLPLNRNGSEQADLTSRKWTFFLDVGEPRIHSDGIRGNLDAACHESTH